MGIRNQKRAVVTWLTVLVSLWATGPAWAEIDGFAIRQITGVGDVSLDSRLGTTLSAAEHLINISDCESYTGEEVEVEFGVDTLNYPSYKYGVAVALPGKTCVTDSTDFAASDDTACIVIESSGELTSSFDEIISLDRLTGGDCTSDSESSSVLYLVISDSNSANVAVEEVLFNVDLRRPGVPQLRELIGGDGRIEVLFDDPDNETEEGLTYEVYWSSEPIADPPGSSVKSDTTSSTSYEIDDESLVNGETYYVRIGATDSADNESALSSEMSVEPVPTTDFWEDYKAAGGTDPGGFCFIATAAYGSPMGADLNLLRAFRDQILWPTALGRAFVRHYYDWGRPAALWIAERPAARAVVRVALQPLVWLSAAATTLGPMTLVLLLTVGLATLVGLMRWRRRRSPETVEVTP